MTIDERPAFSAGVSRLFAAWGKVPDERLLSAWWDGLVSYPLASVLDGLLEAQRGAGRYLPSYGEVQAHVAKADHVPHLSPAMAAAVAEGEMACATCEDTGWVYEDEPHPEAGTGGYRADATRTRVVRCRCWPTNPVYRRTRPRPWTKD